MLRSLRSRRRPRYGAQVCAVVSALLLLLSVSLLHTRISSSSHSDHHHHHHRIGHQIDDDSTTVIVQQNPLLSDSVDDNSNDVVDKIDELDTFEDQKDTTGIRNYDNNDDSLEDESGLNTQNKRSSVSASGYYVDHITGSIRRAFNNKRSIDEWDYDYNSFSVVEEHKKGKAAFGSDDIPIDEEVRRKVNEVNGIEDALLLKIGKRVSPLREGWGDWFDKKGDFLRRDRMFKSNFEVLNPLNNPLLQDPDGVGVTGLTRGDKVVQKLFFNEFKRNPFLVKKPSRVLKMTHEDKVKKNGHNVGIRRSESNFNSMDGIKIAERRIFDENVSTELHGKRIDRNLNKVEKSNMVQSDNLSNRLSTDSMKDSDKNLSSENIRQLGGVENKEAKVTQRKSEELSYIYADGKRWGYFPGLHPHLSFSDFMDSFFRKGKCDMRVFMVWNSPPWMYTVRHQRGLESVLFHHRDACVVVLSETIELDFFAGTFLKDGYKVAVAMPNLDELLKDTPTNVFADVWSEWRRTKFYPTHYSELIRLSALYKYGGIYLDSDIVVLNPLSSLNNIVGLEGQIAGSSLNGAVMAFRKNSPFLIECLKEFYMTYDDTGLRWNGADLLTRVARKFSSKEDKSLKLELRLQPSYIFFPIGSEDITSYFTTPATESEKSQQDALFNKILSESLTFHFWSSVTSALIPEPGSLVARLLDHPCIHCFDVL